jgi:hypothetical protein
MYNLLYSVPELKLVWAVGWAVNLRYATYMPTYQGSWKEKGFVGASTFVH